MVMFRVQCLQLFLMTSATSPLSVRILGDLEIVSCDHIGPMFDQSHPIDANSQLPNEIYAKWSKVI